MTDQGPRRHFPGATEDIRRVGRAPETPQTTSPTYRLAFDDPDFLVRDDLRPLRLQLELLKPELALQEAGITGTVVIFGGARIRPPGEPAPTQAMAAMARYYDEARRFAHLCTERSLAGGGHSHVIVTGGGPGVMEAGNRGAADAGGRSIQLNIVLPFEHAPNTYGTPELAFNFHYFAIRKMTFLTRAQAITVFPGGFGTMDELFEALTLIQTGRMERIPIILFGRTFWERIVNFDALVEAGTISAKDLNLITFAETAEEAMALL